MVKTAGIFALLFVVTALAGAQSLSVDYVDGKVELKTSATTWKPLIEGTKLTTENVLRVSGGGLVEITSGTSKLHLSRDGVYQLSTVLAQGTKTASSNLATLAASKVDKMLNGPKVRVEVADMGARGALKGSGESLNWAGDADPQATLEAALTSQDWSTALVACNQLLAEAPADRPGLLITKARVLAAQGRSAASLKAVRDAQIPRGQAHFMESVLIVASQGLETQDYDLVLSTTTEALKLNPDVEILQNLTLAQALAWQAKGDAAQAQTLLNTVVKLGPKTLIGQEAVRLGGK